VPSLLLLAIVLDFCCFTTLVEKLQYPFLCVIPKVLYYFCLYYVYSGYLMNEIWSKRIVFFIKPLIVLDGNYRCHPFVSASAFLTVYIVDNYSFLQRIYYYYGRSRLRYKHTHTHTHTQTDRYKLLCLYKIIGIYVRTR